MNRTLTELEIEGTALPKWPALLVQGEPITEDQAAEINIRTQSWYLFGTNDKAWARALYRIAGIDPNHVDSYSPESEAAKERFRNEVGMLDLRYLHNDNIASSWINGPHGWVNWAGEVGCRCYNIGKWPSVAQVLEEWQKIAREWPFLTLTSQLLEGEACEEDKQRPLVEYRIQEGQAKAVEPGELLVPKHSGKLHAGELTFLQDNGERGCSTSQFIRGLELARLAVARKGG